MLVRITTSRVGPRTDQHPGDLVELPDEEARLLLERGQAEPAPESATTHPPRTAARPRPQARR